jgi:hypothetical protein
MIQLTAAQPRQVFRQGRVDLMQKRLVKGKDSQATVIARNSLFVNEAGFAVAARAAILFTR